MLFTRIGYRLALQFTAFVFGLLMITGLIFLAADVIHFGRQQHARMERLSDELMQIARNETGDKLVIPPHLRERVRIVRSDGQVIYQGAIFESIAFVSDRPTAHVIIGDDDYRILTRPVLSAAGPLGFVQIAEAERAPSSDVPERALLFLLTSIAISLLTFFVGLFLARRSLEPAQEAMVRLEQFTQDASHELRTPIASINSSLDLALKTGEYHQRITAAKQDVKRMALLIEKLLALAQLDRSRLDRTATDMSALVHASTDAFRDAAHSKGVQMHDAIKDGVTVRGDPTLLRQLVDNLLSNAIKYSGRDSTVTVTLTEKMLMVQDTGIGIHADALPHIFDRFYQENESRSEGGYGLGLALVQRIVDVHGWTIHVTSTHGKGSTFTVNFGRSGAVS